MKYLDFKKLVRDWPVISVSHLLQSANDGQSLKNQLSKWKKQGLIYPLKKGLFVLNEHDRKMHQSREFIANQLVFPSYISLEYALDFYGLVPEKVYQVTSITSKKTAEFENIYGSFVYRNLKVDLFFGFQSLIDENDMPILVAEKEKALLDFLYLNLSQLDMNDQHLLETSFRIDDIGVFDQQRIFEYTKRFSSKKLSLLVSHLFDRQRVQEWNR